LGAFARFFGPATLTAMRLALALAISALVTACALVAEPIPPGTRAVQAVITNKSENPVELTVRVGPGGPVLAGGAHPASIPAGPSTTNVTFYVPPTNQWEIEISDFGAISGQNVVGRGGTILCPAIRIELDRDGGWGQGC
jgi:hypothetical protein